MQPIIFLNIAWMKRYRGLKADTPKGTFSYMLNEEGKVHEAFNFLPVRGKYYGYAAVKNGTINLSKLGGAKGDEYLDNVLVVWTATRPGGGKYIVGWYDNARVLARPEWRPASAATKSFGHRIGYSVVAPIQSSVLLAPDERVLALPKRGKGKPGQSVSFFPALNAEAKWVREARSFIKTGRVNRPIPSFPSSGADPELKAKVELAAVKRVIEHYEAMQFRVISREKDNVGWDLDAFRGDLMLKIEVKGRAGSAQLVEVTPNEYQAMRAKNHRSAYRLCIVTNALSGPAAKLAVFEFSPQSGSWMNETGEVLTIEERVAARLSVI